MLQVFYSTNYVCCVHKFGPSIVLPVNINYDKLWKMYMSQK